LHCLACWEEPSEGDQAKFICVGTRWRCWEEQAQHCVRLTVLCVAAADDCCCLCTGLCAGEQCLRTSASSRWGHPFPTCCRCTCHTTLPTCCRVASVSRVARRYALAAVPAAASACFMLWSLLLKALEWYQVHVHRVHTLLDIAVSIGSCHSDRAHPIDWGRWPSQASVDQVVALYRWAAFVLFPLLADGAMATGGFLQASTSAFPSMHHYIHACCLGLRKDQVVCRSAKLTCRLSCGRLGKQSAGCWPCCGAHLWARQWRHTLQQRGTRLLRSCCMTSRPTQRRGRSHTWLLESRGSNSSAVEDDFTVGTTQNK
jgi:hypothetical protein